MKINLRNLKLRNRESEVFRIHQKGQDSLLGGNGARFLQDMEVEIEIENTGRLLVGKGWVHTLVRLPCSRCLKDVDYPIDAPLNLSMVEDVQSDKFNDDDIIVFSNNEVDIGPQVEEAVFLALPLNPLCSEDCRGLCIRCGADQNAGPCSCSDQEIDPRWEKLKNLK